MPFDNDVETNEELNQDTENIGDEQQNEQNENNVDENNNNDSSDKNKGKRERTFTQAQVSRMMTKEKNQGRNAVYNELGINPNDKKTIEQFKAFVKSLKTDEDIAKEKADEDSKAIKDAESRAFIAEAKAEALMLGIDKKYIDDAITIAKSIKKEDEDIKETLESLKERYPVWFNKQEESDDKGKRGTGNSIGSKNNQSQTEKSIGARLAANRKKSNSNKSSYWTKK